MDLEKYAGIAERPHAEDAQEEAKPAVEIAQSEPVKEEAKAPETPAADKTAPGQFDKGLQQVQQEIGNIKRWQDETSPKLERLTAALEKFSANPTAANAAVVEKQADKAGIDLSGIGDDELLDGKTAKALLSQISEKQRQLEESMSQTRQQVDPLAFDSAVTRAQHAYLGKFPGTKADDFREALALAETEVKSYADVMQGMSPQQRSAFADRVAERVILQHGEGRIKAAPAPEPKFAEPTTPKGSTKITTKTGASSQPNLVAPKTPRSLEDVMRKYGDRPEGFLKNQGPD